MEEKKYAIYNISIRWNQDDYQNNGTSSDRMFLKDPTISGANQLAMNIWDNIVKNKVCHDDIPLKDKNPELIDISVHFLEYESWCLEWFCHYTYNTHLTDKELIQSFDQFVIRKMNQNIRNGHSSTEPNHNSKLPYHCLMGAEDRWRWGNPCRCEGCTKHGVVRITH